MLLGEVVVLTTDVASEAEVEDRPTSRDRAFDMACSYLLCKQVLYTDTQMIRDGN
jgi:hypothetical protein